MYIRGTPSQDFRLSRAKPSDFLPAALLSHRDAESLAAQLSLSINQSINADL